MFKLIYHYTDIPLTPCISYVCNVSQYISIGKQSDTIITIHSYHNHNPRILGGTFDPGFMMAFLRKQQDG